MSIPSWLESEFFSCNDVLKDFDVESVLSSNPFLSTRPVADPPTYHTHHATICNFVDNCNSGSLASCPGHLNPVFMATSPPKDGQSRNLLPGAVPADKRNHKMIEKQRRKDMNALMSILRSVLPDENLQGKRSMSDQVQEAVNYVHHLQQKVEDLKKERDKKKANSDQDAPATGESDREFPTVKIKSMGSAVQVWTNTFEYEIVYSDLLMALEDGGLELVCAASSTINNRIYHTIHTEVSDRNSFDIDILYQKLWHLIRTNHTQDRDSQTVDAQA